MNMKRLLAFVVVVMMIVLLPVYAFANYVPNGDFSQGDEEWASWGGDITPVDYEGKSNCLYLAQGNFYQLVNANMNILEVGKDYELTFTYYATGPLTEPDKARVNISWDWDSSNYSVQFPLEKSGEWVTESAVFTVPEYDGDFWWMIFVWHDPSEPDIYISEVKVTEVGAGGSSETTPAGGGGTDAGSAGSTDAGSVGGGSPTTAPPMGDTTLAFILTGGLSAGAIVVSRRFVKSR